MQRPTGHDLVNRKMKLSGITTKTVNQIKVALFIAVFAGLLVLLTACNTANFSTLSPKPDLNSTVVPANNPFVNAKPDVWIRSNPGGGGAFASIGAGPTGVILAGSDLSGAYISRDLGATWQPIGSAQGLTDDYVASVGFDPQNGSILYFGTRQGIFRSDDGGQTVQHVLLNGYILNIKFSASNPMTGYAAWHPEMDVVGGQIYKTTDRGLIWQQVSSNLPNDLRIVKLLISPIDENTIYLLSGGSRFACGENGLFRSKDGGVTWVRLGSDLPNVQDIALDKLNANNLYFTTFAYVSSSSDHNCQKASPHGGELYKSVDQGDHWTRLAARSGAIWLDPKNEHTIRLIDPGLLDTDSRSGTWESIDDGRNWQLVGNISSWDKGWSQLSWTFSNNFDGTARTFGEDLSDPNALFWITDQFIYVTRDNGRHFKNLYTEEIVPGGWQSTGADNTVMFDMSISSANPNDIYLGFYDIGCWHSPNGGLSWNNCNDPSSTVKVVDGHFEGWHGYGGNTTTILADPSRTGVVWAAQTSDLSYPFTLLRSNDGAATWQKSNSGLPDKSLSGLSLDLNSPVKNRTLFISADKNIYRSKDDGQHWELSLECNGCWSTAVDNFDSSLVYAGGSAGLFISEQGGVSGSWKQIAYSDFTGNGDSPWDDSSWTGTFRIKPDPVVSGRVYVTVFGPGGGLYRGDNRGQSWVKLLTDDYMRDVAITPSDPNIIYATSSSSSCCGGDPTNSHGVLRSLDGGQTWKDVNEGMAWPFAMSIAIDPGNPSVVWVGAPGTGFARRDFKNTSP